MRIEKITAKEAKEFLLPRHYAGRTPSISFAYGWKDDGGILKAVLTIGKPVSPSLCKGICGEKYKANVLELNRLCRDEDFNKPLSQLVSYAIKDLKPKNVILVSYADTAMHHVGYIYQACSFYYTGITKPRTDIWTGKHSRHYTREQQQSDTRVYRSAKHRYVYFCTDKRTKKEMLKALAYPILPYPKGESKHYKLGEYLKPKLVKSKKQA